MLLLDIKNIFQKGNSKIYNFSVEAEFKFALKGAQNSSTDPMKEFHRAGGRKPSSRWEQIKEHRVGGPFTESVEAGTGPVGTILIGGIARWEFHRLGGGTTEPV